MFICSLNIKIQSIERNANDLYDHESKEFTTETHNINKECFIYKSDGLRISSTININKNEKGHTDSHVYNSLNETGNEELVAYVSCNQNNYVLERMYNGEMLKGRVWISVKELRNDVNVYQHQSKKSNDISKDNISNFNKYILHKKSRFIYSTLFRSLFIIIGLKPSISS